MCRPNNASSVHHVHGLVLRICEDVTLHGKKNIADVIKLQILRWEDFRDYLGGHNVIIRVLMGGRQEGQNQRKM